MLNVLFGFAYGLETPFFPQLAAPNLAPKTEVYRTCTEHFMTSIQKAEFGQAVTASPSTAPKSLGPFGPAGGFRLAMVSRFWPSSKPWPMTFFAYPKKLAPGLERLPSHLPFSSAG